MAEFALGVAKVCKSDWRKFVGMSHGLLKCVPVDFVELVAVYRHRLSDEPVRCCSIGAETSSLGHLVGLRGW